MTCWKITSRSLLIAATGVFLSTAYAQERGDAPIASQAPGHTAADSAPTDPDVQAAELMSAMIDAQNRARDLRATSDAMRKEALILELVADQLNDVAGGMDESAEALRSALEMVSQYREAVPAFGEPVSDERFANLTRGVNFSHWFSQSPEGYYTDERLAKYDGRDFTMLYEMGFRHVRFPFDDRLFFDPENPSELNAKYIAAYESKLGAMLDAGLSVIVALQPEDSFKEKLTEPAYADKVAIFWQALTARLSDRDPDRVFFEVLNEPTRILPTPQYRPLQWKLLQAMRTGAPEHTLIASGGNYSGPVDLIKLEPYPDKNIVYNWHHYKPFAFTHQGASWGKETWSGMSELPWPMEFESVQAGLSRSDDREVRKDIVGTTWTKGSEQAMRDELQRVAEWAEKHGVRVTANEMGVYAYKADRVSRLRWHRAMTSTLDELNIGWAIWDYAGGFDVVKTENGARVPDPEMLNALGLNLSNEQAEAAQ